MWKSKHGIALPYGIDGVAWALVGTAAFSGSYMLWLALKCLKARWIDSLRALIPPTILNAVLALALYLVQQLLPSVWRAHGFVNIAIMGTVGGLIYAGSLLYFPNPSLAPERLRWKSQFGLKP